MSDRPHLRRKEPARSAPMRDWSNMFRSSGAAAVAAGADGPGLPANNATPGVVANGSAPAVNSEAPATTVSDEALRGIETAYQVIDQHLREGRSAAEAHGARDGAAGPAAFIAAAPAGTAAAADSLQEVVTQGLRFYSSLAPFWTALVNSLANATVVREAAAAATAFVPPASAPPATATGGAAPAIVEIASTRMARVTVDLPPHADVPNLAIGGLLALAPGPPPLTEVALAIDPALSRIVVRIRVPDGQPPGVYSGVIVDRTCGEPRGTITLRIDA